MSLFQVESLPGRFGIGDLGSSAYEFVDFLRAISAYLRSPTHSEVKGGDPSEHADFAALWRIQYEHAVIGNQLTRPAVEQQNEEHLPTCLVSRVPAVPVSIFAAVDSVHERASFRR
jgi:hypothetical protein